ncbi:agamous MADS-box protein AGL62 [Trifolium repens]|nr:agamous MADS-box protein AGL62 [Trifolium repens]
MSSRKKTQGRKKTGMTKISKESDLQVTFSKRRSGLFKKASELVALCRAYVALIVFSPSGRAFSFSHPDVYGIIDRFLSWVNPQINRMRQFIEATRNANVCELNAHLTLVNDALNFEKKCGDDLSHLCRMTEDPSWWDCPVDGMNQAQLELLKNALEELNNHVAQQANRLVIPDAPTQIEQIDRLGILDDPIQTEQAQMLPTNFFQNPMLQTHLLGFNNMGGGGYGPSGSF